MQRTTRVQGAVLRDHHVLLIKHQEHQGGRAYWLLPGGGIEGAETEVLCLRRELKEETGLEVVVERLLFEEHTSNDAVYRTYKTFLCSASHGDAQPGYEPESEAAEVYAITAVQWLNLRDAAGWASDVTNDKWTYPLLKRIQHALGYV